MHSAEDAGAPPRLQKVLAAAGLGSRRDCEELISEGRVEVDRRVVTELGTRVDPLEQEIRVDGEPLPRPKRQYFMLNKPMGVVSTARDPAGRPRVTDLVGSHQRLFPIGRLDISSEGLILVTNDGELTNLLAHPRYEVEKTYLAQVVGAPSRESLAKLERGVHLAEGYAHAKRVRIKSKHKQSSTLEIVLDEGRNREVRRLLARVGHKVLRLKRVAIGALRLGNLAAGEYRPLRSDEVRELKESALAALDRDKRKPLDRKTKPMVKPPPAIVPEMPVREIEQPVSEHVDDFEPPRRAGTIIGEDDSRIERGRVDRAGEKREASAGAKGGALHVKPLIDVRRGIFPGARGEDFDDDEEVTGVAPARPPAVAPRPSALPPRGTKKKRQGKPRPTVNRGSKQTNRRKGRRR